MSNKNLLSKLCLLMIISFVLVHSATNPPFSTSKCAKYIETGSVFLVYRSAYMQYCQSCSVYPAKSNTITFLWAKSTTTYEVLLSFQTMRQIASYITYMRYDLTKSASSVYIAWQRQYGDGCCLYHISFRYIVKSSQLSHMYFQSYIICPHGQYYSLNTQTPCVILPFFGNRVLTGSLPITYTLDPTYYNDYVIKPFLGSIHIDSYPGMLLTTKITAFMPSLDYINYNISHINQDNKPSCHLGGLSLHFIIFSPLQIKKIYLSLRFLWNSYKVGRPTTLTRTQDIYSSQITTSNTFFGFSGFLLIEEGLEIDIQVIAGRIRSLMKTTSCFFQYKLQYLVQYFQALKCEYCTPYFSSNHNACYDLCPTGYYTNITSYQCTICPFNCNICNGTPCLSCSAGFPVKNGCTSVLGCIDIILSINNLTNNCLSCNLSLGYQHNPTTNTCVCLIGSGFYSNSPLQCIKCPFGCTNCDGNTCFSCPSGFPVQNGCTTVVGCATISLTATTLANNCLSCDTTKGYTYNSISKNCQCLTGYFTNALLQCAPCPLGCIDCDANTCFSCSPSGFPVQQGCTTVVGCSSISLNYTTSADNCLDCSLTNGYKFNSSTKECDCLIGSGFFYNASQQCIKCPLGCTDCDEDTCFNCSSGFPVQNGCTTVVGCTEISLNYTNFVNNCVNCTQTSGYRFDAVLQTCYCLINEGFFYNALLQCTECPLGCYNCTANTCSNCSSGFSVQNGCTTIVGCIDISFNYSSLTDNCLNCSLSMGYRLNSTFSCQCLIDEGFFQNAQQQCTKCPLGCTNCDANTCFSCSSGFSIQNGCTTVIGCKNLLDNYVNIDGNCKQCKIIPGLALNVMRKTCQCILGFYYDSSKQQCIRCNVNCLICDASTCFKCSSGKALQNGCTNINGCLAVISPYNSMDNNCQLCNTIYGFTLDPIFNTCICQEGSVIANGICHKMYGCLIPVLLNDAIFCSNCNKALNFRLFNSTCICTQGYAFNKLNNKCQQFCGDGLLFKQQCDDGNTEDGDGCSSLCKVETSFRCVNNKTIMPASNCLFSSSLSTPITISLQSIGRQQDDNVGIFIIKFSPSYPKHYQKAIISNLKIDLNGTESFSWSFSNTELQLLVNFNQTIQGQRANISFTLGNVHFHKLNLSIEFPVKSKNYPLVYFIKSPYGSMLKLAQVILSFMIVAMFVIASFNHKMAGVELINVYQLMFYCFMMETNITNIYSVLKQYTYVNMNFMFFWNKSNNFVTASGIIKFTAENKVISESIFAIMVIVAFLVVFVTYLIKKAFQVNIQNVRRLFYQIIMFPFAIAYLYQVHFTNYRSQNGNIFQQTGILFIASLISLTLSNIVIILVIFFELKTLFFTKGQDKGQVILQGVPICKPFQGVPRCKPLYVPIYLICYYLILLSLVLSEIYSFKLYRRQILTGVISCLILWFVKVWPYKQKIHNITQLINMLVLLAFLSFSMARNMKQKLTQQDNQLIAVLTFNLIVLTNLIVNAIRIFRLIRQKCKIKKTKDSQLEAMEIDEMVVMKKQDRLATIQYFQHFGVQLMGKTRQEALLDQFQDRLNLQDKNKQINEGQLKIYRQMYKKKLQKYKQRGYKIQEEEL